MCFTPAISLTTALIEWACAIGLLKYGKSKTKIVTALLLFFLGLYQFSEFLQCTTQNTHMGILGFLSYTILPALFFHLIIIHSENIKKMKYPQILYLAPAIFALVPFFKDNFQIDSQCFSVFVLNTNLLTLLEGSKLAPIYYMYYFGFIIGSCLLLMKYYGEKKKESSTWFAISVAVMFLPTTIVIFFLPNMGVLFPSILCQFALLLAGCVIYAEWLQNKEHQ